MRQRGSQTIRDCACMRSHAISRAKELLSRGHAAVAMDPTKVVFDSGKRPAWDAAHLPAYLGTCVSRYR